ncbi:MAG: OsmC family protein [Oligoflexia bacterium]|jgi:organic hydroperoxide reductase OsmC/OhrA
MIQYPQEYFANSRSAAGIATVWKSSAGGMPEVDCAIPPEFQGPGGGSSPEDLYAMALLNCFIATFKVFAEKSRVVFQNIQARGVLVVDRDEKGVPWMARFKLSATVDGVSSESDRERVLVLLEKTSRSCMILNSVKTEKTFEFGVRS